MFSDFNPARRGINLVAGQARSHSNTRLTLGEFIADVLISKDTKDNCCYFVIQRIG